MIDQLLGHAHSAISGYLARSRVVHVLYLDATGHVQFANEAMTTRLGVALDGLRGRPIAAFLTEPDAARLTQCVGTGAPPSEMVVLNFCDRDGLPFTLSSLMAPVENGCLLIGEPMYDSELQLQHRLLELNEDLARLARQRHRSTLDAQEARLQAESDNLAKDRALAVIAHELRQPLGAAVAALGILKLRPSGNERAHTLLERQVAQMTALVEDLLQASRIMHGTLDMRLEPVDLTRIVQEAIEQTQSAAHVRRHTVRLAAPDHPVELLADPARLRQVFVNLLSNAVKYTPEGGTITAVVDGEDACLCRVRVRDTGQGMAAADLEAVFGLFVRATTGGPGLGIGLAVAKRLVELHGGTLTAHSDGLGQGSEFVVTLPVMLPGDSRRASGR